MCCIHRFGRKLEKSQFNCPKCIIDMCWCSIDNVVCKIDEPKKVEIWYKVDESSFPYKTTHIYFLIIRSENLIFLLFLSLVIV